MLSPQASTSSIRHAALLATALLGALFTGCAAHSGMLAVGAQAPELRGRDAAGQPVTLSQQRGKPAIVYFYPKDGTPGCTKEACAFRDAFDRYTQQGIVIFGVSRDSEASHVEFRKEHSLPFPLVADESGELQKAYGVPSMFVVMSSRVTFLVDKQGRIAKVWPDVDPGVHANEVLAAAKALP
jgi:thioredoxin-dependent peroxiredoxin